MKITVDIFDFERAFVAAGRNNNFSYEGKRALFDYLEELEDCTGEELELDVVAICCDFSEETLQDVLDNYGLEDIEELQDNTWCVELDNGNVVYQAY